MARAKIVGMEHRSGTNSKTNRPYDFDVIHTISVKEMTGTERVGQKVEQIMVSRSSGIFGARFPVLGETWGFDYNSDGYLEDAYPIE